LGTAAQSDGTGVWYTDGNAVAPRGLRRWADRHGSIVVRAEDFIAREVDEVRCGRFVGMDDRGIELHRGRDEYQ
jgi:hypothetical protein